MHSRICFYKGFGIGFPTLRAVLDAHKAPGVAAKVRWRHGRVCFPHRTFGGEPAGTQVQGRTPPLLYFYNYSLYTSLGELTQ
jgi:hypothetical protein